LPVLEAGTDDGQHPPDVGDLVAGFGEKLILALLNAKAMGYG
jgi:hypothetical protein